ncbi:MAG: aldehyde dehydrogenase family protein, partial [Actinobacteria bacterium]|nr:aldehyde dehydrogenase family protein [Actinomycetota bacterium]
MRLITHWIDGSAAAVAPERKGPVFDPATGNQTAEVAFAEQADVDAAVASAKTAFASWGVSSLTR